MFFGYHLDTYNEELNFFFDTSKVWIIDNICIFDTI